MPSIRYEGLPKIDVNLRQIVAVDANTVIPFNATILCKTKTGPINQFTTVHSYTEAVEIFGLGDSSTPALYGVEQVLKSYGYMNIIRLASDQAAKGKVKIALSGITSYVPECATDAHTWSDTGKVDENSNKVYACTTCGATKSVDADENDVADTYNYNPSIPTVDEKNVIISGESDYCTDIYNGDEIKLHYEKTRTRLAIRGKLNGQSYSTPLEIIDLSTVTAPELEVVLEKLVRVWNSLETGVTLKNEFVNKLADDEVLITTENLPVGTISEGNCGNEEVLTNQYVIDQLQIIEDPRITKQDVVVVPEFRNYEVVNAGLALQNKYFYIVSAEGETLTEKQDAVQLYNQSDEGVLYTPSKCVMNDVIVPFECAALYAWANSYSVSRYLAPAGTNRAIISIVSDLIDNLSDDNAEVIYNDSKPANPVKYISNYGYTLYGQKTMDPTKEFTNRINVSGLVNYITITGKNLLAPYLFEYTPISTFQRVYMDLSKMLDVLVSNSVIYADYKVVCDESNNTDKTLGAHELHASIAIRPINVVEYIYLDLTVTDNIGGEF